MTVREFCKITDMELCILRGEYAVCWARYTKSGEIETIPDVVLDQEIIDVKAALDGWDEIFLEITLKPLDK